MGNTPEIHPYGDSLSDVFATRNAGVKVRMVLEGHNMADNDTLLKETPDLIMENLEQLPEQLSRWEQQKR